MLPVKQEGKRFFLPIPGGSPYNVALALGRLGVEVQFLGRLSTDSFGALLERTLRESRVDVSLCPKTEELSTLGFVVFDNENKSASYSFYTQQTAGCGLQESDVPAQLSPEVTCLHFGSFSLAAEPIGEALEKMLAFKTPQRIVSLDPNIRPFLIRDRAAYEQRLAKFAAAADLVKLSDEDVQWLHPGFSPAAACRYYLARGASLAVVTRGSAGALGMNARGTVEVEACQVNVFDTIGAGDTFQAALLAWICHQELTSARLAQLTKPQLRELLEFAGQAAALTCSRAGCNPPWAHELPAAGIN